MRILLVCQYFSPEPFKVADLCVELDRAGHSVTVLTGIPNYPEGRPYAGYGWFKRKNEVVGGIRVIRVPLVYRGKTKAGLVCNYLSFAVCGSIRAIRLAQQFDVVFVYQLSPILMAIPGVIYSQIHRIPMVMYTLDLWPDSFSAIEKQGRTWVVSLLDGIVRWIYSHCAGVGVSSRGFVDSVVRSGVPIERLSYIPQYADDPQEDQMVYPKTVLPHELPEGFVISFTGNIGYAQGLTLAIEAAAITKHRAPHIKWVLIGDGRARAELTRKVTRMHLEDTVLFFGRVSESEVVRYLALSDVAVLILRKSPLFSLTVPAKLQTYLACGKPILGSIDGEGARIIEESGAGVVGPADDAGALAANAMKLAGASKETLDEYSSLSRRYFETHFLRARHAEGIVSLLERGMTRK